MGHPLPGDIYDEPSGQSGNIIKTLYERYTVSFEEDHYPQKYLRSHPAGGTAKEPHPDKDGLLGRKKPGFCEVDLMAHCGDIARPNLSFSLHGAALQLGRIWEMRSRASRPKWPKRWKHGGL